MKKLIQLVLFLTIVGCAPATAQFLQFGERDSSGSAEYFPKQHIEAWDKKGSDKYLMISVGICNQDKKNVFYGVYIDFDSSLVQKDTLLAIITTEGSYLLKETKSSRELNKPFTSLFVPDSNPDLFYGFIIKGQVTKISYSGTYFIPNLNADYFSKALKEVKVTPKYFD